MSKLNKNGFLSGHTGDLVFREVNGKQVVQAMPSKYRDAQTDAQLKQRSGMRNVLAHYRILKNIIREQFEDAILPRRAYDCFLHHNILLPPVDLMKDHFDQGLACLAPYIVSYGSLPSLDNEVSDSRLQFPMRSEDWKKGDIIRLIKVQPESLEDVSPTFLYGSYSDYFVKDISDRLISSEPLLPGAYAFVHLRNTPKHLLVSSQKLIVIN